MWDVIWYLGFPMFAVNVFGSPYKKHYDLDNDSIYNSDQYDTVYDQRQNGTENYRVNVDGLSLVWSPNSLLAAAALLEPALYGEYPETNIDVILGPDNTKPEEQPVLKPEIAEKPAENKPTEEKPNKLEESNSTENVESSSPQTVLVIDGAHNPGQKQDYLKNPTTNSKRKLHLPGLIRPFLRSRSADPSLSVKKIN